MVPIKNKNCPQSGFTIIELLVAIAIIGLLIAILIPAVQQARLVARKAQCSNHLKQLGIAMHNYQEAHRVLPPGQFNYMGDDLDHVTQPDGSISEKGPARSCWMQQILPYIDQKPLYDQLPFDSNLAARKWGTDLNVPIWTVVPTLMCPNDPANPKVVTDQGTGPEDSEGFHGNYVMCAGNTEFSLADQGEVTGVGSGHNLNGMFYAISSTRFNEVTDGLSNTVMGGELILNRDKTEAANGGVGARDVRGRYYNSYRGNGLFSTQFPPNSSVPDEVRNCQIPNPVSPCNTGADVIVQYARSYHAGGVNILMADGSVKFLNNSMSTEIFRALGSRAGKENIGEY